MNDQLKNKLNERKQTGNLRQLSIKKHLIDFVSNDYLGLSRSNALYERISSYDYSKIINKNGSTGSRLLAGNSEEYQALEIKLAGIFNAEAALLFNSGYSANLALISSIPQKGDTILYDSLSHVCLKEGAWLSKADSISFQHNDIEDLERKLNRANGNVFVVIESVYSMDGDKAPIQDIIRLSKKYNAELIVDEAHGTGVFGKDGSGLVCEMGVEQDFLGRVYTFGKGMGVHGACVCGSRELIDYLINFGRPFIYTTALPVHSIFSIDAAFDYLKENIKLQNLLKSKITFFNQLFLEQVTEVNGLKKPFSDTAVQPIVIPGNDRIKKISDKLQQGGLDVRPILSPTVKTGTERLRVSLHTHNSEDQIEKLVDTLVKHL
ncbi:8-amino-7-oxononanoate synthase [Reichenbachiella sp. MALMAid0571]|uniref:aminotransferase class I/II-fold pyridoxal phosphate-dependent enzyme n=1 Tax=Reichenbachiella sp. MALMAid0571 TaxID=3143939 RepID=UPI0032DF0CC2